MIFLIYFLLTTVTEGALGEGREVGRQELDLLYSDCSRYEADLFGGPVCGSDGKTYRNSVHLSCHNYKSGGEVKVSSHGSCPGETEKGGCPWNPLYRPICGSDGKTYPNNESLICHNNKDGQDVKLVREGECRERNPCTEEGRRGPRVCASNGLTYHNAEAVRCLRRHHADLEVSHEGGCTVEEVNSLYSGRRKVCEISKHHHEYNPVCGPGNHTYGNPFIFLCVSPLAGSVSSGGGCSSNSTLACRRALQLDNRYEQCKKSTHLPEVCGTDGLTYRSRDHLICAARNNSQLRVVHEGGCGWEDSPCLKVKELEEPVPVCGSDGITYASFQALSCVARSRDPGLRFVHVGVCVNRKTSDCYGQHCFP